MVAQQVMVMPLDRRTTEAGPAIANLDTWSGYAAARERLLDHLGERGLKNVVVTTGDEHKAYAGELNGAGGAPAAVEFVATSAASGGDGADQAPNAAGLLAHNPHLKFISDQRGYLICDVGRDAWRSDFKVVDRVSTPGGTVSTRRSFVVERGAPGLERA